MQISIAEIVLCKYHHGQLDMGSLFKALAIDAWQNMSTKMKPNTLLALKRIEKEMYENFPLQINAPLFKLPYLKVYLSMSSLTKAKPLIKK